MSNQFTGEQLPQQVKQYVRQVEKKLCMRSRLKREVISNLVALIQERNTRGEAYDTILEELGCPEIKAEELNDDHAEESYRKSPWRWAFLGLAGVSGVWILVNWILERASLGIIGGADGPTAILVTGENTLPGMGNLLLSLALVTGIMGFLLAGHLKRE